MLKKRVKTKWKGKLWVNAKYLNAVKNEGETLVIIYDGQEMTITRNGLDDIEFTKGDRQYEDQFSNTKYWLYGFKFEPDQLKLF